MNKNRTARDWGALMCLVLFWGSSFAFTKLALVSVSAEWIVALRLLVSTVVLIPILILTRTKLPTSQNLWLWYTGLAMIGCLIPFLLITLGLNVIDSSLGAIFIGTTPLFVLLFAHLFLPDEKMNRQKLIGFVVGFFGIIALMNPHSLYQLSFSTDKLLGQAALLASAMLYASHMVASRFLKGSKPLQTMTGMSIIATIFSLLYALWASPDGLSGITLEASIYIAILGIFPTALAGVILYHTIQITGARFVSLSNYLLPVVALIIGMIFLDESLTLWVLIGMVLILIGIGISEYKKADKSP